MQASPTQDSLAQEVLFSIDGAIATITLNRPHQRNALSVNANNRLHALWERVDADPSIRVAILTSTDCGSFCAGMDLKEAAATKQSTGKDMLELLTDPFQERQRCVAVPIIAAITGHFTAAGMLLVANCDMRVGLAGTAGGIAEAKVGRGTSWAAPMLAMLPQAVLMELITTAEMMPVERLHALGFINAVEPTPDAVRAKALAMARLIAANAPLSVKAGKAGLLASSNFGADAGYAMSKEFHRAVYSSEDAQEGPRAFSEKRAPRWTGR